MKLPLLVIVGSAAAAVLTSCTTLENRADLYSPRNYYANGPYTRMLHSGIPKVETVFVQATASRSGSGQAFSPYYGK